METADGRVRGQGINLGGYFLDVDDTGRACLGWGDTGVEGYGSLLGGYFWDFDNTGEAYLGYGDGGVLAEEIYGIEGYGIYYGGYFQDTDSGADVRLGYGSYGLYTDYPIHTGDIVFAKDGEQLWRMFEDEDGLYVESLKTGKVYSFVLQEVGSGKLVESGNMQQEPSGVYVNGLTAAVGVVAFGLAIGLSRYGLPRYRARKNKKKMDAQQHSLSQWQ